MLWSVHAHCLLALLICAPVRYGNLPPDFVFVERKTHKESWKGEESVKERFTISEDKVVPFIDAWLYAPIHSHKSSFMLAAWLVALMVSHKVAGLVLGLAPVRSSWAIRPIALVLSILEMWPIMHSRLCACRKIHAAIA
eukprot:1150028-Pelagomonas_calceolata.AAC.2